MRSCPSLARRFTSKDSQSRINSQPMHASKPSWRPFNHGQLLLIYLIFDDLGKRFRWGNHTCGNVLSSSGQAQPSRVCNSD